MKKIIALLYVTTLLLHAQTNSGKQIIDLRGNWKFEVGDNKQYADPKYDDRKWGEIFVPSDWENEGFPGYDGYAWYRKTFTLPASSQNKKLSLRLGYVDDVCGVYVNGNLIGEGGSFPPDFETAYNQEQEFLIPKKFLRPDQTNVIAVRVYDDRLNGGIAKGKIGIIEQSDELEYLVTLPEQWKFKTGDTPEWKNPSFDDGKWQELIVPAKWDFQGYRDYDGFAWYRVSFDVPANLPGEDLVMMLGKIDDFDEAYLNGEKIGSTGRIRSDGSVSRVRDEYLDFRAYDIPQSAIQRGKKNVLAVRVYDNMLIGGIYEGPVGIVTQKEFRKWNRNNDRQRTNDTPIDRFFEKLFEK